MVTVRVTVAVWVRPPPVAVMVRVRLPSEVFLGTLIESEEEPVPPEMVRGVKVTVEPEGAPVADSVMVELKPPAAAVAMVKLAAPLPWRTETEAGAADRVKDGFVGCCWAGGLWGLEEELATSAATRAGVGLPQPVTRSKPGTAE